MTEQVRTSVVLKPEQKAALDEADKPNSEIIRDLVEGWRKHGATQEVFEEELQSEIDMIESEIATKERRKEQKQEQLERLQGQSLTPSDEETVQQYLNKDLDNLVWFNPSFNAISDHSTATLSEEELLKEVAKRAEQLPIDSVVRECRNEDSNTLSLDRVRPNDFVANRTYQEPPSKEFVGELLEIRHKTLQDRETDETEAETDVAESVS